MIVYRDLLRVPYVRGEFDPNIGLDCMTTTLLLLERHGIPVKIVRDSLDPEATMAAWAEGSDWMEVEHWVDGSIEGDVAVFEIDQHDAPGVGMIVGNHRKLVVSCFPGNGVRAVPLSYLVQRMMKVYRWAGQR